MLSATPSSAAQQATNTSTNINNTNTSTNINNINPSNCTLDKEYITRQELERRRLEKSRLFAQYGADDVMFWNVLTPEERFLDEEEDDLLVMQRAWNNESKKSPLLVAVDHPGQVSSIVRMIHCNE